jgi:hypothetical protein
MGVCASKLKTTINDTVGTIDKEAVEMSVRGRKVDIAQRCKNLASEWQSRISRGENISISPAEVLPLKDTSNIKLNLNSSTTPKELLTTALYVSTNTIYRDQLKHEVWLEVSKSMEKNKKTPLGEKFHSHGESLCNPLVDVALDKHVITSMAAAIQQDLPLVSDEEIAQVNHYRAAHPIKDEKAAAADAAALRDEHKESGLQPGATTSTTTMTTTTSASMPAAQQQLGQQQPITKTETLTISDTTKNDKPFDATKTYDKDGVAIDQTQRKDSVTFDDRPRDPVLQRHETDQALRA